MNFSALSGSVKNREGEQLAVPKQRGGDATLLDVLDSLLDLPAGEHRQLLRVLRRQSCATTVLERMHKLESADDAAASNAVLSKDLVHIVGQILQQEGQPPDKVCANVQHRNYFFSFLFGFAPP
jgi:hypothetical protein